MRLNILPFAALALLSAVVAHPTNGQDAGEVVDFDAFPKLAGLGSLDDLVDGGAFKSDTDGDVDADGEGIEARAANQCTLAKLKKIMFDYSEWHPSVPRHVLSSNMNGFYRILTNCRKGITEFEAARNAKSPSCFNWDSDKCTLSPDRPAKCKTLGVLISTRRTSGIPSTRLGPTEISARICWTSAPSTRVSASWLRGRCAPFWRISMLRLCLRLVRRWICRWENRVSFCSVEGSLWTCIGACCMVAVESVVGRGLFSNTLTMTCPSLPSGFQGRLTFQHGATCNLALLLSQGKASSSRC
jgi:hypothetical protein